ncbi:MAG: HEAT repeat domain-containing protein [Nitrospira sp.]|nr:HEAT repeat domain-containing protein [Nitrospira sp.]MCW5786871.1 HEAT repeat domain-containing protein [Nitrospira sp.]
MSMRRYGRVRLLSCLVSLLSANCLIAGCYVDVPPGGPVEVSMRLTELLTDSDPDVRRTAAESLGKIGERSAGHGLLAALKDHDPRVRAAAARSLGNLGDGASGVLLAGRLADSSEAVRVASALALSEIESSASSEAESLRMLHHQDAAVRLAATRALGGQDIVRFRGELVGALQDPDARVRQGVVAALGETGDGRAILYLVRLLKNDSSAGVRSEAAFRLGKLGGTSVLRELTGTAQADTDPITRVWARWAVKQITSSRGSD